MAREAKAGRDEAPPANPVTAFNEICFRPRAFFSRAGKRSSVGPVLFAALVSGLSGLGSAIFARVDDGASLMGWILRDVATTVVGVYAIAGILHGLLRIIGTGMVVRAKPAAASATGATDAALDRYEPPKNEGSLEKARPGAFSETLAAVGYSRAPYLLGVFGAIGVLAGLIWSLVLLAIALAQVHRMSLLRGYVTSVGLTLGPICFALTLRLGVVEAFKIPSGSMMPSVMMGDHVFVNKLVYGPLLPNSDTRLFSKLPPARGDAVVFKFPENKQQDFIKRVIALPGDTLEVINGRPIINGWLVPHCAAGMWGKDNGKLFVEFLGDASYLTLFADPFEGEGEEATCKTQDDCSAGQACRSGICGRLQGPWKIKPNETWVLGDNRHNSHDSRSWRGGLGAGVPFENIKGRAGLVWMSFAPNGGVASERLFLDLTDKPRLPSSTQPSVQAAIDKCLGERPAQTTPPSAESAR